MTRSVAMTMHSGGGDTRVKQLQENMASRNVLSHHPHGSVHNDTQVCHRPPAVPQPYVTATHGNVALTENEGDGSTGNVTSHTECPSVRLSAVLRRTANTVDITTAGCVASNSLMLAADLVTTTSLPFNMHWLTSTWCTCNTNMRA